MLALCATAKLANEKIFCLFFYRNLFSFLGCRGGLHIILLFVGVVDGVIVYGWNAVAVVVVVDLFAVVNVGFVQEEITPLVVELLGCRVLFHNGL